MDHVMNMTVFQTDNHCVVLPSISVPQAFAVHTFYKWLLLYFLELMKSIAFKLKFILLLHILNMYSLLLQYSELNNLFSFLLEKWVMWLIWWCRVFRKIQGARHCCSLCDWLMYEKYLISGSFHCSSVSFIQQSAWKTLKLRIFWDILLEDSELHTRCHENLKSHMKNSVLCRSKCKWWTLLTKLNTNVCDQNIFFIFKTSAFLSSLFMNIKVFYGSVFATYWEYCGQRL
jgi:hypothetical protein